MNHDSRASTCAATRPLRNGRALRWLTAAALALGITATMSPPKQALAADLGVSRLNVDWRYVLDVLRDGDVALFPKERASLAAASPIEENLLGTSADISLVARDWGGAQLLVGQMTVTDQIRLSRSVRMVMTRVRLAEGRLAPFAHVGLGQWRVDTDLMPGRPFDVEPAAQFGGGFELRLYAQCRLALELDYTVLYRDHHEPQHISATGVLGSFFVARASF